MPFNNKFDPKKARLAETRSHMSTSKQAPNQFSTPTYTNGSVGRTVNFGSMRGGGIGPTNSMNMNRRVAPMPPIPPGAIYGE